MQKITWNIFLTAMFAKHKKIALGGMFALLLLTVVVNIFLGAFDVTLQEAWQSMFDHESIYYQVVTRLRIPRILMSLVVGIAFGICGTVMQTLFKNPLADPSLIGVSAGASAGVVLFMLLTSLFNISETAWGKYFINYFTVPTSAFVGAIFTIWLIYKLSKVYGKISVSIMLLSGIALNALLGALIGMFTYVSDDATLRSFTFWTLGSLSSASYRNLLVLTPAIVLIFLATMYKRSELNLLLLGEDEAKNAGANTELLKKMLVVSVALGIGISVAYCGIISFVGLVVPHISRLLIGSNHNYLLPFSGLFGGFMLIWTDTIARTVISPAELPIGIITALFGAPFFLWLLLQTKKEMT